jgi:hypothetical protein
MKYSALVAIVLLGMTSPSWGSCDKLESAAEEYQSADLVVVGQVVGVASKFTHTNTALQASIQYYEWKIVVEQQWKGAEGDTVSVCSPTSKGMQGYLFVPGERYLIYAWLSPETWESFTTVSNGQTFPFWMTSDCSRTIPYSEAIEEIASHPEAAWTRGVE